MAKGIKADDIEALLSGNLKLDEDGIPPWILVLMGNGVRFEESLR